MFYNFKNVFPMFFYLIFASQRQTIGPDQSAPGGGGGGDSDLCMHYSKGQFAGILRV